jgi:hypothetical protein
MNVNIFLVGFDDVAKADASMALAVASPKFCEKIWACAVKLTKAKKIRLSRFFFIRVYLVCLVYFIF